MIDWSKPIETADGEPVKVVFETRDGSRLVVNMVAAFTTYWCDPDGTTFGRYPDIRNVPETVSRWMNVYADHEYQSSDRRLVSWWRSRVDADAARLSNCELLYLIREDRKGDDITITKEGV